VAVAPDTFKKVVGALLGVIVLLALAPWTWIGGSDAASLQGLPQLPPDHLPSGYPPDHSPPGYYPPAPSTAVGMTPAWRQFAARVDATCAISFNYALLQQARTRELAKTQGWSAPRAEDAVTRAWGQEDARILGATARMGPPPERPLLFARWRANVRLRTRHFFEASRAGGLSQDERESTILHRIFALKKRSDRIGQQFGLRICTSN
jgi:hypothetical protein